VGRSARAEQRSPGLYCLSRDSLLDEVNARASHPAATTEPMNPSGVANPAGLRTEHALSFELRSLIDLIQVAAELTLYQLSHAI